MVEDIGLISHVKTFFVDHQPLHPPRPALSEQSTSNPVASTQHHHYPPFQSPLASAPAALYAPEARLANQAEEEEEEEEEEVESDSEAEAGRATTLNQIQNPVLVGGEARRAATKPNELMQLEMSEDIRLGSPEDGSNYLDSDFNMLRGNPAAINNSMDHQRRVGLRRAESSSRIWQMSIPNPPAGKKLF